MGGFWDSGFRSSQLEANQGGRNLGNCGYGFGMWGSRTTCSRKDLLF